MISNPNIRKGEKGLALLQAYFLQVAKCMYGKAILQAPLRVAAMLPELNTQQYECFKPDAMHIL